MRALWFLFAWGMLVAFGCSEGDDDGDGERSCGDGLCSNSTCETQARCPVDCGTCVGPGCDVGGNNGNCTESCSTSCDCLNQGELCTADYGVSPGTCIPDDCLLCTNFDACAYVVNADGVCDAVTCT